MRFTGPHGWHHDGLELRSRTLAGVGALAAALAGFSCSSRALGVAARRAGVLPDRWRSVPLAVGVLWLPVFAAGEALGDVISPDRDFVGLRPRGLAWIALGYAIWPRRREQQRRSTLNRAALTR
jgi:hypothetical protein